MKYISPEIATKINHNLIEGIPNKSKGIIKENHKKIQYNINKIY